MVGTAVHARTLQRRLEQLVDVTWPSSPLPETARAVYLKAAASSDWPGLIALAKQQRRDARSALGLITRLQEKVRGTHRDIATHADDLLAGWVRPDRRADWPQVRAQLVATLKPQTGVAKAEALADDFGATTARAVKSRMEKPVADLDEFLANSAEQWRAALVGARLAEAIAALNTRRPRPLVPGPFGDDIVSPLAAELNDRLTQLCDTIGSSDRDAIRTNARSLADWARGTTLDDTVRRAVDLSVARRDVASRWTLGPAAQAAGELIRNLILAQAIGLTVEEAALLGGDNLDRWRAASALPLPNELGPGQDVTLAQLKSNPATFDGDDVFVSGVVGQVTIKHVRGKVLSTASLLDEDGLSLTVGIEHIKLDSGGLDEGAYATVAGRYVADDPVFNHTPILRVGRHSYEDEGEHSFLAAATHLTRWVVTPVPHGLRYVSSWERGLSGANNQLRYGTWLPFERRL
ncbi:hypothetical protein GA0070214_103247 [Micromonospora chaiyaphumensis]|uniref:Uncharacterized protein n=1 Tax=Micromonospora chaiyaphumensis TaxID=307119 RepID=A0A1C4W5Y5_9ACTN|nr:hypothetical protein GA0070214_103247 [Micromonospora chaiyaphumensis]